MKVRKGGETNVRSMQDRTPTADLFEKFGEPSLRRMKSLSVNERGTSWPTRQV